MIGGRSWSLTLLSLTAFAVAAALAFQSLKKKPSSDDGPAVGRIMEFEGEGSLARAGSGSVEPVSVGAVLRERDALILTQGALTFEFAGGAQARVEGPARLAVDRPDPDGRARAYLEGGAVAPAGADKPGASAVIVREGRAYDLKSGELAEKPRKMTILLDPRGAELAAGALDDLALEEPGAPGSQDKPLAASGASAGSAASLNAGASESASGPASPSADAAKNKPKGYAPGVFSDEEIEVSLSSQAGNFKRCAIAFVEREKKLGGAGLKPGQDVVLMSFKIQPNGRAVEAKAVGGAGDGQLQRCMAEVIERVSFKRFDGKAIAVGEYPIRIE